MTPGRALGPRYVHDVGSRSQPPLCRNCIARGAGWNILPIDLATSSWASVISIRGPASAEVSAEHQWSNQMTHMMRTCSVLMIAALGLVVVATPGLAQNAPQCVVSGSPPAGWGFNSIGYIEIASGGSCMFSVNIAGEILSSSVSQNPAHGTLQQLNTSSFIYTSEAGYRGRDTFSVQATGKSPTSSGTSVTTINATLQ